MGYGTKVDGVIGGLSRLLHVRSAKVNTLGDVEPYLGLSAAEMFPEPPPVGPVKVRRSLIDRAIKSSTVTWRSSHEVISPAYRRRHEKEYEKNLDARLRWLRPDGRPRKSCLVYVHGWLEPGSWAEETTLFRKWARELDCDLAHVSLPFHGTRKPRSALFSGEFFWTADLVRSFEGVRQAVCDARSAIEWLKREGGYEQIGVSGISLGGSITMILGCVAPTPDYIVPIVSHLQLADAVENAGILWRMKHDLEKWGLDREGRTALFDRLGWASYPPVLAPEKQLWIQAREDAYIDASLAERQWKDWGEPNILWIEGGHMTFPLHVGEMTTRIAEFQRSLSK